MRSICLTIAGFVLLPLIGGCTYYERDHHHHRYRDDGIRYRDRYDGYYGRGVYDRPRYYERYRCD
jgi:hypothetical protein